jgi:predicted TIM-barrel fold metal-dependent hydrolase
MSAVPNSAGTAPPAQAVPPRTCDSHMHSYDPRFAAEGPIVPGGAVPEYRQLQARMGTTRTVIVTPAAYVFDNQATLAAIADLGADRTRGVAVLSPAVSDTELERLNAGGIRGIRFTMFNAATAVTTFDMVEPLAQRVHELGWHVQLHWRGDQIVDQAALLARLRCILVFDHMARLPRPENEHHAAFGIVARLLQDGQAWVKLSGPYLDDTGPDYATRGPIVQALARLAPDRLVWGSDWPHRTEKVVPDDAHLLNRFDAWLGDASLRKRILVDNPAALYGFAAA